MTYLPANWITATGHDLFAFVTSGSRGWAKYYCSEGANFIRIGNLQRQSIELDLTSIQKVSLPVSIEGQRTRLKPNDILVSITAELGLIALVPEETGEAYINQHIALVRPVASDVAPYIARYLQSPAGQAAIGLSNRGVTKAGLGLDDIRSLQIPLPPFSEQRRIVAKIDSLSAKSKRARDHLDHIPRLVEKYKQAILAAAYDGTFGIAANRPALPLQDLVASLDQGWSPKCDSVAAEEGEWSVMKTTAIQPLLFRPGENKRLPPHLKPRPALTVEKDDVLVTRAGPRSRVAISCMVTKTQPRLMLCDKAYRLRLRGSRAVPAFVAYMLNAPQSLKLLEEMKTGISDSGLNLTQSKFLSLPFPNVGVEGQRKLVHKIEVAFAWIDRLIYGANCARNLISHLDQAVLAKAFRGELIPQDPNDEPATALLARIRATKEGSNGRRRKVERDLFGN